MIMLHYTGMLIATAALEHLRTAASQVSAHYFVFEDGRVVQMVPESKRAWHAGAAVWAGESDINSCSIGIEIANPGHDYGYPDFPKRQMAAVTALCRGILTRNTIPPERVLGPFRRCTGAQAGSRREIPVAHAARFGVGNWVNPAGITAGELLALGDRGDAVSTMQQSLSEYGYGVAVNGNYDSAMHETVAAFQRHFRPERIDGVSDMSTRSTLKDLLAHRGRSRTMAARAITFERLVIAS